MGDRVSEGRKVMEDVSLAGCAGMGGQNLESEGRRVGD